VTGFLVVLEAEVVQNKLLEPRPEVPENTPNTSPSQGNDGGTGLYFPFGNLYPAGGGGGATDPGGAATSSAPGNGGNGTASAISGVSPSPSYAGGGGGARGEGGTRSSGGTGGGGQGANVGNAGGNGVANTGGGGGGGRAEPAPGDTGGTGGSGIVILKYLVPVGTTVTHIYKGSGSWVAPEGVTAVDYLVVAGGWRW
jgi:hypothetical protein